MAIKPVDSTLNNNNKSNILDKKSNKNAAFTGNGNLIITTMDAIDRGGFAASFIIQDQAGAAWPRILAGMTRNSEETGGINWSFAAMEAMRELLSGPSTFILPAMVLGLTKKSFGKANAVPTKHIMALGESFQEFIKDKPAEALKDTKQLKLDFYAHTMENVINTSTNGKAKNAKEIAKGYAERLVAIETAPKKPFLKKITGKAVEGSRDDLKAALMDDFIELRKANNGVKDLGNVVQLKYSKGKASMSLNGFFKNIRNYTEDAGKSLAKKVRKGATEGLEKLAENLKYSRVASRVLTNIAMIAPVFLFLKIVPKIYKSINKTNPGLQGIDVKEENKQPTSEVKTDKPQEATQPSFTGLMSTAGRAISQKTKFLNIFDKCEFDGFMASIPAMTGIMYGGALIPRFINAYDKHDRREILVRDLTSMTAVLYLAKALTKGFSEGFSKLSGFALNLKPENHKGILRKIWNYANPMSGLQVLNSEQLASKYSRIENYEKGIEGFCDFVKDGGGKLNKVLAYDSEIKSVVEKITGKSLAECSEKEIRTALKNADKKGSKLIKQFYEIMRNPNNKLVKKAKTMNSTFGFLSTIVLVPGLMIFLSKFNERLTKKILAKEKAQKDAEKNQGYASNVSLIKNAQNSSNNSQKQTYAAFLGK